MTLIKHEPLVRNFQVSFNQPVDLDAATYRKERSNLRNKLFREERAELLDAMVDIAFIALGTGIECEEAQRFATSEYTKARNLCKSYFGSYAVFDEAFKRVYESNMSKLVDGKPVVNGQNGVLDENHPLGKVLKPDTYKPVCLEDLV